MKNSKVLDDRTLPLEPNQYYHIYNRGNNKNNIFFTTENYRYFLGKYAKYMIDYVDTFAYCLLPNHFHFLIRVKSKEKLDLQGHKDLVSLNSQTQNTEGTSILNAAKNISEDLINKKISKTISNRFRLLFMSYAKAINKQEELTGSLFQKVFRRKRIDDLNYLFRLVGYIHTNPYHHKIYNNIEDYEYSSYKGILSDKTTLLKREEVLDWFGSRKEFIESHKAIINLDRNNKYWIEEDI